MEWDAAFANFPVLETERLLLRKMELTDARSMYQYFSKDEVTRFYDLETFTSEQEALDLIQGLFYRYNEKKQIRWGIQLKGHHGIIGSCGFHTLEKENFKAEIGYELDPDYWGKGIMAETIGQIITYGFQEMGLNRVEAFYNPLNVASHKVLEKNGFQFEGVLKKRFFIKGKFIDAAIAAVVNDNFKIEMIKN